MGLLFFFIIIFLIIVDESNAWLQEIMIDFYRIGSILEWSKKRSTYLKHQQKRELCEIAQIFINKWRFCQLAFYKSKYIEK